MDQAGGDSADLFLEEAFNDPGIVQEEEVMRRPPKRSSKSSRETKKVKVERPKKEKKPRPQKLERPAKPAFPGKKQKPSRQPPKPVIPIDSDIPLNPGEEVLWKGTHDKRSENGAYVGFALGMGLGIYCFGVAAGSQLSLQSSYWNIFLIILVVMITTISYLVRKSVEGHKILGLFHILIASLASLLFSLTFISALYEQITTQYNISVPSGIPEQFVSLQNLPISSLIFIGMVLLLFGVISAIKSETPKQYKASFTAAGLVVLLTGVAYLFKPDLLADRDAHKIMALTLFAASAIVFSAVLFFGLITKKTKYTITNQRIVIIKEYLGKEAWMKNYNEIEKVTAKKGLLGSKVGYGDVILFTITPTKRQHILYLNGVPEPFVVENMIYTRISMLRKDKT